MHFQLLADVFAYLMGEFYFCVIDNRDAQNEFDSGKLLCLLLCYSPMSWGLNSKSQMILRFLSSSSTKELGRRPACGVSRLPVTFTLSAAPRCGYRRVGFRGFGSRA